MQEAEAADEAKPASPPAENGFTEPATPTSDASYAARADGCRVLNDLWTMIGGDQAVMRDEDPAGDDSAVLPHTLSKNNSRLKKRSWNRRISELLGQASPDLGGGALPPAQPRPLSRQHSSAYSLYSSGGRRQSNDGSEGYSRASSSFLDRARSSFSIGSSPASSRRGSAASSVADRSGDGWGFDGSWASPTLLPQNEQQQQQQPQVSALDGAAVQMQMQEHAPSTPSTGRTEDSDSNVIRRRPWLRFGLKRRLSLSSGTTKSSLSEAPASPPPFANRLHEDLLRLDVDRLLFVFQWHPQYLRKALLADDRHGMKRLRRSLSELATRSLWPDPDTIGPQAWQRWALVGTLWQALEAAADAAARRADDINEAANQRAAAEGKILEEFVLPEEFFLSDDSPATALLAGIAEQPACQQALRDALGPVLEDISTEVARQRQREPLRRVRSDDDLQEELAEAYERGAASQLLPGGTGDGTPGAARQRAAEETVALALAERVLDRLLTADLPRILLDACRQVGALATTLRARALSLGRCFLSLRVVVPMVCSFSLREDTMQNTERRRVLSRVAKLLQNAFSDAAAAAGSDAAQDVNSSEALGSTVAAERSETGAASAAPKTDAAEEDEHIQPISAPEDEKQQQQQQQQHRQEASRGRRGTTGSVGVMSEEEAAFMRRSAPKIYALLHRLCPLSMTVDDQATRSGMRVRMRDFDLMLDLERELLFRHELHRNVSDAAQERQQDGNQEQRAEVADERCEDGNVDQQRRQQEQQQLLRPKRLNSLRSMLPFVKKRHSDEAKALLPRASSDIAAHPSESVAGGGARAAVGLTPLALAALLRVAVCLVPNTAVNQEDHVATAPVLEQQMDRRALERLVHGKQKELEELASFVETLHDRMRQQQQLLRLVPRCHRAPFVVAQLLRTQSEPAQFTNRRAGTPTRQGQAVDEVLRRMAGIKRQLLIQPNDYLSD